MNTQTMRLDPAPGWRTLLLQWGRWRVLVGVTLFAVVASMGLTLLLLQALGRAQSIPIGLAIAGVVPLIIAPLVFNVLIKLVFEIESTRAALHRLATRDALTQTYNRGYFTERLEAEAVRAARTGQALALLMIDADEFKSINDRFGHAAGDQVLQLMAQACQSSLRPYDLLARFGGEEFVVLLPEATLAQACEVAERVIAAVAALEPATPTGEPLRVTVSVGVAVLASTDSGGTSLLHRADAALYHAKRNGRNTWAC
jgi:diguanylate cyclase (GGDEF)-like protein